MWKTTSGSTMERRRSVLRVAPSAVGMTSLGADFRAPTARIRCTTIPRTTRTGPATDVVIAARASLSIVLLLAMNACAQPVDRRSIALVNDASTRETSRVQNAHGLVHPWAVA